VVAMDHLSYTQLAKLYRPPYGERAVVHKQTQQLLGACGCVPCLDAFEQCAEFFPAPRPSHHWLSTPEGSLFYAMTPAFRGQGFATEYENAASLGVRRKIAMGMAHNPYPQPPGLQIVGVLENDASKWRARDRLRPSA
jgi:hypothetical protein